MPGTADEAAVLQAESATLETGAPASEEGAAP